MLLTKKSSGTGAQGVTVDFTEGGIRAVARIAAEVNGQVENIGARRLQTVMEKLLEELSFGTFMADQEKVVIDAAYVNQRLGELAADEDLSRYVL